MLTITKHANRQAIQRLGFTPPEVRRRLFWLYERATAVGRALLPSWFTALRNQVVAFGHPSDATER